MEPHRRRQGGRGRRLGGHQVPQLPPQQVINPYPPMEVLSADQLEAIHATSLRILEELGMEVMSTRALELLRAAGAYVDPATHNVRLDRGLVEAHAVPRAASRSFSRRAMRPNASSSAQITSISGSSPDRPTCMISSEAAGPVITRIIATSSASPSTSTPFICSAIRSVRRSSCRRIRGIWTPIGQISCIPIWSSTARQSAPDARSTACG